MWHIRRKFTVMQEPAYILKNGHSVPYIPVTITTNREAYAASLHVLFKHVADFHICVVRVFSAKYGIPEDDILKTIQESDEFKNMQVDPVLDTDNIDSLGYLAEVLAPKEEVPVTELPEHVVVNPIILTEKLRPVEERESDPSAIKTKTIRKKIVAPKTDVTIPTPEPVVIVAEPVTRPADEPELIKPKTIRKKIVPKPTQTITEPTQPITEPVKAASSVPTAAPATTVITAAPVTPAPATTVITAASSVPTTVITAASSVPTTAITAASSVPTTVITAASSVPTSAEDAPRKIIKKKAKPAA